MKKVILSILLLACVHASQAQREGRLGVYSGLYMSSLMNANDLQFGDYLPTVKMSGGLEGSYFLTVGKKIGVGLSGQVGYWSLGQNYKGAYADGSEYEAFSRLKYFQIGMGLNVSTNLRRRVAARMFGGVNVGFLNSYQERYEQFRVDDKKLIIDIKDQDVYYRDQVNEYGTLRQKLYEPLALSTYFGAGFDIKITDDFIFSLMGRMDVGMGNVEKEFPKNSPNTITFDGEQSRTVDFPTAPAAIKHHGPTKVGVVREPTVNQSIGVYVSFVYRIFNRDRPELWYIR